MPCCPLCRRSPWPVADTAPSAAIAEICTDEGVLVSDVRGPGRRARLMRVRRRIALALRQMGLTDAEIGEHLHRHGTTVYHMLKGS